MASDGYERRNSGTKAPFYIGVAKTLGQMNFTPSAYSDAPYVNVTFMVPITSAFGVRR